MTTPAAMVKAKEPPARPWAGLLALFAGAGFFETAFYGQINAFTPLHLPSLGVSPERVDDWTAWIVVIANAFGILFLPFWGALADRYSRKPVIVRSFVAHILAIVLMLAAGNVWVFIAGRAAMNLALGNTGLMMTTLAERVPPHRMGFAFAILNGASPIGAFLGPLGGGRVIDAWSFDALLAVNAVVMIGVIAFMVFGYRDSFRGSAGSGVFRMASESVLLILRSPRLRALFPALFTLFSGWMLAMTYLPLAVTSLYRGDSPGTVVGMVTAAGGLAALVLSPLVGALSDRIGFWRVLLWGAVVEVLLWPLPALAGTVVSFALAWAVLNGVLSAVFSISFAVLSASTPESIRGRVMSFAYLPVNIAFVVGPLLASFVVDRLGVMAVFPLAAILTLIAIALLLHASRKPLEV